jgi:hypothetical protein
MTRTPPTLAALEAQLVARLDGLPADPEVAILLLDDLPGARGALEAAAAALPPMVRTVVAAHGRWSVFDDEALVLADLPAVAGPVARRVLEEAGWLDGDAFVLAAQVARRVALPPSPAMIDRAADAAEQAFHRWRCAGAGDRAARAAIDHRTRWGPMPEVAQWGRIVAEEPIEEPCDRCAAWVAIERSRAARWRGHDDQARRRLQEARALARTDRARFFVDFLHAIRTTGLPGAADRIEALAKDVPAEEEWHFVHQARATLASARGADPRFHLERAVALARDLRMPFREVHLRLLLALSLWPNGERMRAELEPIDLDGVSLSARDRWNLSWAWVRADLASDDLESARRRAREMLADEAVAALSAGVPWAVVAVVGRVLGSSDADDARVAARRYLTRDDDGAMRDWLERSWVSGSHRPLPDLRLGDAGPGLRVRADGSAICVAGEWVELSRSPVAVALLEALIAGPATPDTLIEAAWPGDASDYTSLRNRLHSAMRSLRKRGLGDHVTFDGACYRLERVAVDG